MLAGSENLQHCCEHSHHFSDKVNWNYNELFFKVVDFNDV